MPAEEGLMSLRTDFVPSLQGVGLPLFDLVNLPFHGDDPVGHDGCLVDDKRFAQAFPGSTRGHHPGDFPGLPGAAEPLEEAGSKRFLRVLAGQCPVKIGADELCLQWGRLNS